jgi:hypothetical protein
MENRSATSFYGMSLGDLSSSSLTSCTIFNFRIPCIYFHFSGAHVYRGCFLYEAERFEVAREGEDFTRSEHVVA